MFNKTNEKDQGHDEDEEENQDDPGPVLLPQTPRVKHDREERRKNTSMRNSSRRSSGRVLTGKRSLSLMTSKRTSRKASRVAQQKISKNCEELSNLGKKMRRPLNSADSTEEGDDEAEEDDADEQPTASKRLKSIGKILGF